MSTRPDEKYENPDDVAEIVEAERTMGDYKLKMDKNYIAPEGERVDAKHKRLQVRGRAAAVVTCGPPGTSACKLAGLWCM